MECDKETLIVDLDNWKQSLKKSKLPKWEDLPEIDLYMDQVIILLNQYLDPICNSSDEKSITPPMINNYVKLKTIPAPVKKKYSKIHLAYLIMVCILKQTLSISIVKTLIPLGLSEEIMHKKYNTFITNQERVLGSIIDQVEKSADQIFNANEDLEENVDDFAMEMAGSANVLKILTEKIATIKINNEKKITEKK